MNIGISALAGFAATIGSAICATALGAQTTSAPSVDRTVMTTAVQKQKTATVVAAGGSVFSYAPRWSWSEKVNGAVVHRYSEEYRLSGGSAIYLTEPGTNRRVIIDFYNNEVTGLGNQATPIAWVSDGVSAANLTYARHAGGSFSMTTSTTWTERDSNGRQIFTFKESRRDCCTVYLFDASRNMQIGLNTVSKAAYYSFGNAQPTKLYDLTSISAVQFFSRAVID